jgi:hypothetical protein
MRAFDTKLSYLTFACQAESKAIRESATLRLWYLSPFLHEIVLVVVKISAMAQGVSSVKTDRLGEASSNVSG